MILSATRMTTLILVLTLLTVPLAVGGMVASVQALHAAALVLALLYQFLLAGEPQRVTPWLVPWIAFSAYIAFQISTAFVAPDPLMAFTREQWMEPPLDPTRFPNTVNIGFALQSWASFSVYWITAWLVASLDRRALRWVLAAIVVLASFESLYGLLAFAVGQESILGIWSKTYYTGDVTGTFVNRNHFAGMLAVCLPIGAAFLFASRRQGGVIPSQPLRSAATVLYVLVVGTAIVNSHSRLGVFATLIGVTAWFWLLARSADNQEQKMIRWMPIAMIALIVIGTLWFGPVTIVERFLRLPDDTNRLTIWSAMLEFPPSVWLSGIGAGAFVDAFRLVQPADLQRSYTFAHNDWLEFALEFGVVGIALIAAALIYWYRQSRPSPLTIVQLAAAGGIIAMAVHSVGDFNLHIRGSAMVFWTAVGIFMNPNLQHRNRRNDLRGRPP